MEQSTTDKDRSGIGAGDGSSSTRPYLIRALHEWCTDNGFTPYIAVQVDHFVQVPMEYVSNNEIVLNVGFDATSSLELGNDFIQFKARFGGVAREIIVPIDHVVAIYARENGQGMAFPAPDATAAGEPVATPALASLAGRPAAVKESPRPPTPLHGLRLAPTPDAREGVPALETPPDDEPDSPAPGGGRPTLKRVK